jgi:hypothetical protein
VASTNDERKEILGSNGAVADHGHNHWLPLSLAQVRNHSPFGLY